MVVGGMIGSGIFLLPGYAAEPLADGNMLLLAWVLGGGLALLGAFCTAELATIYPHTGGDFIYLLNVYGKFPAFLYGWICLTVTGCGSVAILALFSAKYLTPFLSRFPAAEINEIPLAIIIVGVLTTLHYMRVPVGARFQSLLTVLKVGGIIVLAFYFLNADIQPEIRSTISTANSWMGLTRALIPVYFAYTGWNCAGYIAGEVANPGKTLPLAFIAGTIIVTSLYTLLNAGFLNVMGIQAMQGNPLVSISALEKVGQIQAGQLVHLLILVSVLSTLSIIIQTSARILQSMGEQGVFFRKLGEVSAKSQTPVFALTIQGLLAIILLIFLDIHRLVDSTTILMVLFSALVISAVLKVRKLKNYKINNTEIFRMPFYPAIPLVYILSALFITGGVVRYYFELGDMLPLWGLLILLAGWPVYYLWGKYYH